LEIGIWELMANRGPRRAAAGFDDPVAARRQGAERAGNHGAQPAGIRWRAAVIVLAGVLSYSNSLSGPPLFDDHASLLENQHIRTLLPSSVLFPERENPLAGRPLVNLSFAVNYAIGGLDVRGYHVWNLAVHLLCGLVVFGLVRRTLDQPRVADRFSRRSIDVAFATALLWVVHPLNTEAVDYLTQRTESMMALFYLLTMYASVRAIGAPRPIRWQGAALVACALGMACKESMVTSPIMVVVYDRAFVFGSLREALRSRGRFYAVLAATWLILAALVSSGPRMYSAGFSTDVSPWTYLLNQSVMIARYLGLVFWPRSLVLAYGYPRPVALVGVLPYAAFVIVLLIVTAVTFIRHPPLGFAGVWFFLTLAPTSSILPIATEVGAERRMYLPLVGLIALIVAALSLLSDATHHGLLEGPEPPRAWRAAELSALLLLSAALGMGTYTRNREYVSALAMARTSLARWPTPVAHAMLGKALAEAGEHQAAIAEYLEAVTEYSPALYDLGGELFDAGRFAEAAGDLQALLARKPPRKQMLSARTMIGRAAMVQRNWSEAADEFQTVLRIDPSNSTARGFLADSLFQARMFQAAIPQYRQYLAARPDDPGALTNLGMALSATGSNEAAIGVFREAVRMDPRSASTRHNLISALLNQNDINGAVVEAGRAVNDLPGDAAGHDLLGRGLALQGHLDEASKEFERALQIDPGNAQARADLGEVRRARRGSASEPR
jgi:tetratricopeptide (TPR) repeat protein